MSNNDDLKRMMEQQLQGFLLQKHQLQATQMEIESALDELQGSEEAYKIVGNIMVRSEPQKLKEDLEKRKELVEIRLKNLEKQERQIREKAGEQHDG